MNVDIASILFEIAGQAIEFFSGSFFIAALKFFLFVYVMVLFADVVLLLVLRGISGDLKRVLFATDRPFITRSTLIKRWEKILARLESENQSQYKVALLEADTLAEEILEGIGYAGATMGEKLDHVKSGQLETKESLAMAHAVRNRVVHETDFLLSREEVQQCLEMYKQFFDEVELF